MKKSVLLIILIFISCVSTCFGDEKISDKKNFRMGWGACKKASELENFFNITKELHFTAISVLKKPEDMKTFTEFAQKAGIDSYYWLVPTPPKDSPKDYLQVMSDEEQEILKKSRADKERAIHGFQFGGEPLPENREVLHSSIHCFHRKEVIEATKAQIKLIIESCPDLTGIAFDKFGYWNYKCCYCEESEKQLAEFHSKHKNITLEEARKQFSLQTLVRFYNDMADYARSLKPEIKTTAHIWPVFLDEPLYGNRLNIDYCQQTVAWFFKPYWSDEKIISYTKTTVDEAKKYFPRQNGIPFFGLYWNKSEGMNKNPERLRHELEIIFSNTDSRNIGTCGFTSIVESPDHIKVVKEIFVKYGIIK